MIRITALNDDSSSSSSDEDDSKITKEAEETIAVSEYMRALKYKSENRINDSLTLFRELLETQVLHEVGSAPKDQRDKLFYVKYNCHKNLGFIYNQKNDKNAALDHLLSAFELDDTDVFTVYKLGQLALEMKKIELAQMAFEKCLKKNPNHWPSADGVLRCLCLQENYAEAYGWALMWYEKDNSYQHGLDVILEIREKFFDFGFEYIENLWNNKFCDTHLKRTNAKSVFPEYSNEKTIECKQIAKPNFDGFKLDGDFSWLSFGRLILKMYEHFEDDIPAIAYSFKLDELIASGQGVNNGGENSVDDIGDDNADIGDEIGDIVSTINGKTFNGGGSGSSEENPDELNTFTDGDEEKESHQQPPELSTQDPNQQKDNSNSNPDVIFLVPSVGAAEQTSGEGSAAEDSDVGNGGGGGSTGGSKAPIGILESVSGGVSSSTISISSTTGVAPSNTTTTKPRQRRRGSDLSFLEQWGWHKNKRYVQRKKSHERNDPDASINGILRRTLAKYFEENFDSEGDNPFTTTTGEIPPVKGQNSDSLIKTQNNAKDSTTVTCESFQEETKVIFTQFFNDVNDGYIDLMIMLLKWCQYISQMWNQKIPNELLEIYQKLYVFHLNHYDLATWNLLPSEDFKAEFRMTLFYLELFHDRSAIKAASNFVKNQVDELWFRLYNHILFHSGMYEIEDDLDAGIYGKYKKRMHWLQYCLAKYENDLSLAVDWVYTIEHLIKLEVENVKNFELILPNQHENNRIDLSTLSDLKIQLERTISLKSVKHLYASKKWSELIEILTESLRKTANDDLYDYENTAVIKSTTQFEILLEAQWTLEQYDDCIQWAERCLQYSLENFLKAPNDTYRQTKWAESVTFVLVYIESLILNESIAICDSLGHRYFSRLIQNLTRLVVNQLDSPYDKNNNPMHPINTKISWIIFHHILQREEYISNCDTIRKKKAITEKSVGGGGGSTVVTLGPNKTPSTGENTEDVDYSLPNSLVIFFTAHEYLGLRGWCTKHNGELLLYILDTVAGRLRTPLLEPFRDVIAEYLEQVTYCLYGYPAKRARARHIEEHDAINVDLTWTRAVQLFDIYRPDTLPEYNSYKNDSISIDMEQLLQRIIALVPREIDPTDHVDAIDNYINGTGVELPPPFNQLPYQIDCIYYLMADHYFKNRDLCKSIKFYVLDLTTCPQRFDAWAGLALSKASKLETKLNSTGLFSLNDFLLQSEEALRCFQQCFKLDANQTPLWIEYGNFAYIMHSFCSRSLKQASATLSMERFEFIEEKKEQCLNIAFDCFNTVEQATNKITSSDCTNNDDAAHDEKWLYHYMLGKIAEKRKEQPDKFIDHYIKSAKFLYEHNASYPFKISYGNPQNLSIEALEVYYRITSSIIKHMEQHSNITKAVGRLFIRILKEVNSSPFALNQAKIDDNSINALKRKFANDEAAAAARKQIKIDESGGVVNAVSENKLSEIGTSENDGGVIVSDKPSTEMIHLKLLDTKLSAGVIPQNTGPIDATAAVIGTTDYETAMTIDIPPVSLQVSTTTSGTDGGGDNVNSPSRRGSQESNATTTTTGTATTTTTGSDSTSSSSSDSSSSESSSSSDSESESSEDDAKNGDQPLSENEQETIYKICIKNLEECVTRFPEHYKSIYRLVNIYLHAPEKIKDLKKCRQLLLGTYTTGLGNQIQGLFADRKINNLFNGVWRIPCSEIDRPGSFSAHLSKCIINLMEVLRLTADHRILLELALQLQRNPDSDKRYIKDAERKELFQQAITFCMQSFRKLLKEHGTDKRDDHELVLLLIEISKAHKKCIKHMFQKESMFSALLVDTYKCYLDGKYGSNSSIRLIDNFSYLDYAFKFCQHEITARKNLEKNGGVIPPPFTLPDFVFKKDYNTNSMSSGGFGQQHINPIGHHQQQQPIPVAAHQQQHHQQTFMSSNTNVSQAVALNLSQQNSSNIVTAPSNRVSSGDNGIISVGNAVSSSSSSLTITTTTGLSSISTQPMSTSSAAMASKFTSAISMTPVTQTPLSTTSVSFRSTNNTPTTTTTSMNINPYSLLASLGTSSAAVSTSGSGTASLLSTVVGASSFSSSQASQPARPRGRPPGSKNAPNLSSPGSFANSLFTNSSTGPNRIDPTALNTLMGIYSNPSLLPSASNISDPATITALLNEYYKLNSMTGMSSLLSGMGQMFPLPSSSASASTSTSIASNTPPLPPSPAPTKSPALPQFDMKNLLSGATKSSTTQLPSQIPSPSSTTSTVISIGSGQLTITPAAGQNNSISSTKTTYSRADLTTISPIGGTSGNNTSKIFSDMPGISVTKVKPKSDIQTSSSSATSLLSNSTNINIPKDLPKSLTITPTPAGYTGKPPSMMTTQYPQVTVQPEKSLQFQQSKPPKPTNKQRKKQQQSQQLTQQQQQQQNLNAQAAAAYLYSSSGVIPPFSGSNTTNNSNANSAAAFNAAALNEYTKMAMFLKFSEIMNKTNIGGGGSTTGSAANGGSGGITSGNSQSNNFLAQYEEFTRLSRDQPQRSTKNKQTKSSNQQQPQTTAPVKGRVSVKQLQSLQAPQPSSSPSLLNQNISPAKTFTSMASSSQKFHVPDIPSRPPSSGSTKNLSHHHLHQLQRQSSSTPPVLAHSPNKSPVLPPVTVTPPGGAGGVGSHQISPTKSLQQILAERQKALNAASAGHGTRERRDSDSVIILD